MKITLFTFNPFAENTYLLEGTDKACILVDPGMMDEKEEKEIFQYISTAGLKLTRVLNTHCHIDHVLGFYAVHKHYGIEPEFMTEEEPVFESCPRVAEMYGIPYLHHSGATIRIDLKKTIRLADEELEVRWVPGHAPGHVIFIDHNGRNVIAGDTLFNGSVGRTDLPLGDHDLLMQKIKSEIYSLEDDYTVWPGHGPQTSVGQEKRSNPFVRG